MLGVLVFDTLPGLFIGIGVSLLLLVYRASRPNVAELGRPPSGPEQWNDLRRHPENAGVEGVVVLRVEGALFFADADHVRGRGAQRAERDGVHAVVLDLETVPFVDVTAAEMLGRLRDELDARGVRLYVARDVGQVRDVLRRTGEDRRVYPTIADAVRAADERGRR